MNLGNWQDLIDPIVIVFILVLYAKSRRVIGLLGKVLGKCGSSVDPIQPSESAGARTNAHKNPQLLQPPDMKTLWRQNQRRLMVLEIQASLKCSG